MNIRKMLITLCWLLFLLSAVGVLTFAAKAADKEEVVDSAVSSDDFDFVTSSTSATLTTYKGTGGHVTIPGTMTDNGTIYNVTAIGDSAFAYNSAITSVTIPDSIITIGDSVFYYCIHLSSVEIDALSQLTSIGNGAFKSCESLKTISLPDNLETLGKEAFSDCGSLKTIMIPNNVDVIAESTFSDCHSLENVSLPNKIETIGDNAFYGCSISNIFLPTSVISIGDKAFGWCTSLLSIEIPYGVKSVNYCAFGYCSALTSVTIPSTVTNLGAYAFADCTSLTSITIPYSVTSIGTCTFRSCTNLSTVIFTDSSQLSSIGEFAFDDAGIISITIPNSVTSLAHGAFYRCTSLKKIKITNSVTSIGDQCFAYCSSLTSATFEDNIQLASFGGNVFSYCTLLTSITLPSNMTGLSDSTFFDCKSLAFISLPDSITHIDYAAFLGCTSLTSIVLPSALTTIDSSAFEGCTALKTVTIPDNVQSINTRTFYDCSSLSCAYFLGKQPTTFSTDAFDNTASDFSIFYHIRFFSDWQYAYGGAHAGGYLKYWLTSLPFSILTLNLQDGSEAQSSYVVVDKASRLIPAPDEPSRTGYTFGGWYTDTAFTTAFDFSKDTVSDDLVLYARWVPGTFKLSGITPYDSAGKKIDIIPSNIDFKAQVFVDIPKLSGSCYYVILALYDANGRFLDTYLSGPLAADAQVLSIGFDIAGKSYAIGKIEALLLNGSNSFKPLAEAVSYYTE